MGIRVNNGDAVGMIGNNFDTHPDYRHDLFLQVQQLARGVGDVTSGKADEFLERAYEQNWWHTEDKLAEVQDKFQEDDMINNTPGRRRNCLNVSNPRSGRSARPQVPSAAPRLPRRITTARLSSAKFQLETIHEKVSILFKNRHFL